MTTTTREFIAERDARIFAARKTGSSIADIAKKFGMSSNAVSSSIKRMLEKLNREALNAYPEILRMELERLDSLQQSIWPMTQHRMITLPDGTQQMLEPDPKMVQTALQIMKDRAKLLGLEQTTVNFNVDEPVRSSMAGADKAVAVATHSPESEARRMLEVMLKSGILPEDFIKGVLGGTPKELESAQIVEAEIVHE